MSNHITKPRVLRTISVIFSLAILAGVTLAQARPSAGIKNIVLVHGALIDGSAWKNVYDILIKDGYRVSIVQQPMTGPMLT